jgi:acyl-CoA synthetase (AMP-forming)/AMP-acid ligase II
MGWTNSHLHEFLVGELHFGEPGDDFNVPPIDYAAIELIQLAPRVGSTVRYLYDFGDHWDLIIRGGLNVFPRDVEDALAEHPFVAFAGVMGRPDPRVGEEVVAFVALRPGAQATAQELVDFGRERLGGCKYAREVRMIDQMPLTPVGKVDRKRLRALVAD